MGSCLSSILPRPKPNKSKSAGMEEETHPQPVDERDNNAVVEAAQIRRRALLVGITYTNPPSNTWSPLDGPHGDVDRYRELLTSALSHT
jgi:hypothetical protein